MKDIVTVSLGKCGAGISSKFWNNIAFEHGLNANGFYEGDSRNQTNNMDVYFDALRAGKYAARAVAIDFESGGLNALRLSDYRKLFKPDNIVCGNEGTGNNWAKGYYNCGMKLLDSVVNVIRKEAEQSDCLDAIQLVHSIGGGCGGALSSLLLPSLRDMFPKIIIAGNTVIPSPAVSELVIEPYNAIFSIVNLADFTDVIFTFDNEALVDICTNRLQIVRPKMSHLNELAAKAMSGVSKSFRFPGMLNCDFAKLARAMIPFPGSQFLLESVDPLNEELFVCHRPCVRKIVSELFNNKSMMSACDTRLGKYIAAGCIITNSFHLHTFEKEAGEMLHKCSNLFNTEISPNLQVLSSTLPPKHIPASVTFLGNNTAITHLWKRLIKGFTQLFKKNAYVHWYRDEGMNLDEFVTKLESIKALTGRIEETEMKFSLKEPIYKHKPIDDMVSDLESAGSDFSAFK